MNWSRETSLAARMVSLEFSKFVEQCCEMEGQRYAGICSSPCTPKKPVPKVPDQFGEYDSHFSIMLLSVIPPKAKERLLEENEDIITSLDVLDTLWKFVAPGGQEETKGIIKFL